MTKDFDPLTLLYQALGSDIGIIVETNNREKLKQRLYAARAAASDTTLAKLTLITSPTNTKHLWIVKKEAA